MKNEKRAELLMDHYKDTFTHILYHWKVRNRLFIYILILLAVLALDAVKPKSVSNLVNQYISKTVSAKTLIHTGQSQKTEWLDLSVLGSLSWFVLLCLVIQYYQRSIYVDRQYRYIDNVENQICRLMGGDYVTREGKAYYSKIGINSEKHSDRRPIFLKAVGPLYIYIFPTLLSAFVITKVLYDNYPPEPVTDYFNLVVASVIVIYNLFYIIWVIFRK
jgi:hypothetical protein